MKLQLLTIFIVSSALLVGIASVSHHSLKKLEDDEALLVMREIGHKILLSGGDSTSRVLPIKRTQRHTFLLQFENRFSFIPDTLVKIIRSHLMSSGLPRQHTVDIIDKANNEIVYGYKIAKNEEQSIIPCVGRMQPIAAYEVKIAFHGSPILATYFDNHFSLVPIAMIIFLSFIGLRYVRKGKKKNAGQNTAFITIGNYTFYPDSQLLALDDKSVKLTAKESKLLQVFAKSQDKVLDREILMKEVWEDEGVIVGRSLDVFVSKLRGKLSKDPSLCITNIHGKGYKLETNRLGGPTSKL
ncbi:winged helix-turn-helix domain-containing protein [Fulvivirgaceae bacterium BMA12]|uniref:Winged helix-turn-helix domain-containing protein n=1 Tax=Agaribacillus aureus TaxID=3051825 RepID=A0ABT8LK67_9BACT|nr:winged helix-turn-helix domain-containing protein [Fulvivirgaceae bacterium BMA12]